MSELRLVSISFGLCRNTKGWLQQRKSKRSSAPLFHFLCWFCLPWETMVTIQPKYNFISMWPLIRKIKYELKSRRQPVLNWSKLKADKTLQNSTFQHLDPTTKWSSSARVFPVKFVCLRTWVNKISSRVFQMLNISNDSLQSSKVVVNLQLPLTTIYD